MNFRTVGYIVVSTLVTIGSVLWYERDDYQPQPQDFAELMNAVQERCLATRFMTNSPGAQPIIASNSQYSIVKAGDDVYSFYYGTNSIPYSIPTFEPVAPYTNTTQIRENWKPGPGMGGDFISYNPIAIQKTYTENDPTNRWIIGTYESFTVSGFPESAFNGTYTRAYYAWLQPDLTWWIYNMGYTNSEGCSMSPGENQTDFWRGDRYSWTDSYYSMPSLPWFNSQVSDVSGVYDPPYEPFYIACTRGPLATNILVSTVGTNFVTNAVPEKIVDRPCFKKTCVYDWTVDNRRPSYSDFLLTIDNQIFGTFNDNEHIYDRGWFSGWIYSPMLRPMLTNSVSDWYGWFYDHAFFVSPDKWGVSSFTNLAELEIDLDSLGITNIIDFGCNGWTLKVRAFDDATIVTNQWYYTPAAGPTFGSIEKRMFDQRRTVLEQCTVLRSHGSRAQWVPPGTNNVRWSGLVWSTNGYADVCAKAKAACTNTSTQAGAPYYYCYSFKNETPDRYYMAIQSRDAKLVAFFDTNNTCEISAYLKAAPNATFYAYPTNRFFGNDTTVPFTTNIYSLADTVGSGRHQTYSSLVVSNQINTFPPVPPTTGFQANRMIGYTLEGLNAAEIITKWDFQYCQP